YHAMFRNNVFSNDNGPLVAIEPRNSAGDSSQDITFANNTGVTESVGGQFIQIGSNGASNLVTLIDNLWLAPNIVPGAHLTAAVFIIDDNPDVLALSAGNVWQMPN